MTSQDDYELLPHQEVEHLRKEVEKLRTSPSGSAKIDQRLINSIEQLNHSIQKLESVFDSVRKDILKDYEVNEKPEDLLKKLIEQNKSVAEVLVSLVEKINNLEANQNKMPQSDFSLKEEPKVQEKNQISEDDNKPNDFDLHKKKIEEDFNDIKKPEPPKSPVQKEEKKGFLGMFKK
ncbi:MAG: hypothetical protein ACMXX6_01025 [Candidatus Woesearchaeota archaeon]